MSQGDFAAKIGVAFQQVREHPIRAIAQLVESVADQQPPVKSSTARPGAAKRRERRPRTSGTQV